MLALTLDKMVEFYLGKGDLDTAECLSSRALRLRRLQLADTLARAGKVQAYAADNTRAALSYRSALELLDQADAGAKLRAEVQSEFEKLLPPPRTSEPRPQRRSTGVVPRGR